MKSFFVLAYSATLFSALHAVDIGNLHNCTEDIKKALASGVQEPQYFTTDYAQLMATLSSASVRESFPAVYQQEVVDPFIAYLENLGESGFTTLFQNEPSDDQSAFLQQIIPDIAEAILQRGEAYATTSTNAFEELVSDLYDSFLSNENRISNETGEQIRPPDRGLLDPIVKWGNPDAGPYTWPVDATLQLNVGAAVVSLPPAHLKEGLLAWSALGHETGGHDILHADTGLLEELGNNVYDAIVAELGGNTFLANYWKGCIDETSSDVLGILHLGPVAGIGLVGYFRGLTGGKLRSQGTMADPHPLDILRGFLAAYVVAHLSFAEAQEWSKVIQAEVTKDLETIYLVDPNTNYTYRIPTPQAIQSAQIVATTILNTKLNALEGHSLKEIQDWADKDQKVVDNLAALLHQNGKLPDSYRDSSTYFGAYVVVAAVQEALKGGANIQKLFDRMIEFLDALHERNTSWEQNHSYLDGCPCKKPKPKYALLPCPFRKPKYAFLPCPFRKPKKLTDSMV